MYVAFWSLYIWQLKFPLPETLANMFSICLCIIKLEIITFYTNKTKKVTIVFFSHNFYLPSLSGHLLAIARLSNKMWLEVARTYCDGTWLSYSTCTLTFITLSYNWHATNNNLKNKLLHSSVKLCNINDQIVQLIKFQCFIDY